jgi:hypothetical protein
MTEKIDVRDLPEDQVRLVREFVEFLRQKAKRHPGREKTKEDISFAEWPLEVKGNLRRSEIYDHL